AQCVPEPGRPRACTHRTGAPSRGGSAVNQVIGLLAMSYGTARGLDDVEAYYTHVRRGRPPTAEQLAELQDRYRAIGGRSPLIEITEAQVRGLEKVLNEEGAPPSFRAYHGMKHQHPYLEDAVEE